MLATDANGALKFWCVDTGRELGTAIHSNSPITAMCWVQLPCGKPAVGLMCTTGVVGIWRLSEKYLPTSPFISFAILCVGLQAASRTTNSCYSCIISQECLLAASVSGRLRVWSISSDSAYMSIIQSSSDSRLYLDSSLRCGVDPSGKGTDIVALHFRTSGPDPVQRTLIVLYKLPGML